MTDVLTNSSQLAQHLGESVAIRGEYRVQNIFPRKIMTELPDGRFHQSSKVVHLGLDDGSVVRLWVRPDDEMGALAGKQAVARGKLIPAEAPANPAMAAPNAAPSLIEIESVEEA